MAATETLRARRVRRVGLRQRLDHIVQEGPDAEAEGDAGSVCLRAAFL